MSAETRPRNHGNPVHILLFAPGIIESLAQGVSRQSTAAPPAPPRCYLPSDVNPDLTLTVAQRPITLPPSHPSSTRLASFIQKARNT